MNMTCRLLAIFFLLRLTSFELMAADAKTISLFQNAVYFDGYAGTVDSPLPQGWVRHRNDLIARKLSADELESLGKNLTLNIRIKAACDNYDRIGSFNLALVPKGMSSYNPESVAHLELGRFITPFMNKNLEPSEVKYTFKLDNVLDILKDQNLNAQFDIWAELEVFGVPYAANVQVAGCKDRNDVFIGAADFVTEPGSRATPNTLLIPLNFRKNLNNYEAGASDAIGKTVRTIHFQLDTDVQNAQFHLITSNHGANAGGEEYNRRNHFVYLNNNLLGSYKPGGISCEPYRVYNTQANGIYGYTPRTPEQWASFSNWCPGQEIPVRVYEVGTLKAGAHTFSIAVPDAVFVGGQGHIPVSLYLQGQK